MKLVSTIYLNHNPGRTKLSNAHFKPSDWLIKYFSQLEGLKQHLQVKLFLSCSIGPCLVFSVVKIQSYGLEIVGISD